MTLQHTESHALHNFQVSHLLGNSCKSSIHDLSTLKIWISHQSCLLLIWLFSSLLSSLSSYLMISDGKLETERMSGRGSSKAKPQRDEVSWRSIFCRHENRGKDTCHKKFHCISHTCMEVREWVCKTDRRRSLCTTSWNSEQIFLSWKTNLHYSKDSFQLASRLILNSNFT